MDPIQYQEICDFLLHKKYPDHIDSKGLKSNFRRKVVKFCNPSMLQLLCRFTNVTQIGSITEVASTLQESINKKMMYSEQTKVFQHHKTHVY